MPRRRASRAFVQMASLLGLAVLGAVFAGIYYAPQHVEFREHGVPAFNPDPGEVRVFTIWPGVPGGPILVEVTVHEGEVDVYMMDQEWSQSLPGEGRLHLDRPFSFHAQWSRTKVNSTFTTTIVSDGATSYVLAIDNSQSYYRGGADPDPDPETTAKVKVTTRYLEAEQRSLVLGYLAATPSVLVVLLALARQGRRYRKRRRP